MKGISRSFREEFLYSWSIIKRYCHEPRPFTVENAMLYAVWAGGQLRDVRHIGLDRALVMIPQEERSLFCKWCVLGKDHDSGHLRLMEVFKNYAQPAREEKIA